MFNTSSTKRVKAKRIPRVRTSDTEPSRDHISHILLYGHHSTCLEVASQFSKINMETKYYTDIEQMALSVNLRTTSAIFVEPIPGTTTALAVKDFQRNALTQKISLFAIVTDDKSADATRKLYKLGLRDVFQWNDRADIVPKLVKQHLKSTKMGRGLTPQDRRLSGAIMNRLKIIMGAGLDIHISVRNGKANIMGKLKTLQKKSKIEEIISSTPGVSDVTTKAVVVPITQKLDRELTKKLQGKLQADPSVKEGTLSLEVHDAVVSVAGTACDKHDVRRILKLIQSIDQIRSINNFIIVSKEQAEKDQTLAKKAKNLISRFFIHSNINVSIVKNTAFLTGKVDLEDKKNFASTLLKQHLHRIDNIVNKITIV